jgi:two-component system sensor histidine kinase BaeS
MVLVAAVAIAVVALGVLRVGSEAFASLMVAAGDSASFAQEMFDHSIAVVLAAAILVAIVAAIVVAWLLAARLARPVERLSRAADTIASGDLTTRVPEEGPPELRSLAAAYNAMADELAEQEEMRRQFIANASHELRTPLTNLRGYLEALHDGVMTPSPELFASLGEEVDRLTRLAASLDVLAGADEARPHAGAVDLTAAVRSGLDLAAPAFARRAIDVVVDAPTPVVVIARADDVAQVVANLLQNAARYTPPGGTVSVEARREGAEGVVRISNSGTPIPADELPRVWERFYRVEKSRDRSTGGAGIGLAIVRRLVEDGGGRVGAGSDAARTTFWFSLPTG